MRRGFEINMKKIVALFFMLVTTSVWAGAGGYIGEYDNRSYGSLEVSEYSAITRLWLNKTNTGWSRCTGTFVDNNLILTNSHCALSCVHGENCSADFWDGKKYVTTKIEPVMLNENFRTFEGDDWAFFMAYDANPKNGNVVSETTLGDVKFGGYGTLRVITNDELPIIRKIAEETYKKYYSKCEKTSDWLECWWDYIEDEIKKAGLKPLTGDSDKLKVQKCKIIKNNVSIDGSVYQNMVTTDCDSAGGDSGSALMRGNSLVGLYNSGVNSLTLQIAENNMGKALKTQNFYPHLNEAKKIVEQKLKGTWTEPKPEAQPEQKPEQKPEQPAKKKPVTDKATMKRMYEEYMNGFQCD